MSQSDRFDPNAPDEEDSAGKLVLFGISLTPPVAAVLMVLIGAGLGFWLWTKFVTPALETRNTIADDIAQKEREIEQQGNIEEEMEQARLNLAAAKQQQDGILSLFTEEENLSTLLLDINRQVTARNPDASPASIQNRLAERNCPAYVRQNYQNIDDRVDGFFATAQLKTFEPVDPTEDPGPNPVSDGYEVIQDSSLGPNANGMLKRASYRVEMQGNFDQTRLIFMQLEQLKPLLLVEEFQSQVQERSVLVDPRGPLSTCQPEVTLETSFILHALLPVSLEELTERAEQEAAEEAAAEEEAAE